MRRITSADELRQLQAASRGYLFNDSPRAAVLHAASCDLDEAERWVKVHRGAHWQRCAYCLPPPSSPSATMYSGATVC